MVISLLSLASCDQEDGRKLYRTNEKVTSQVDEAVGEIIKQPAEGFSAEMSEDVQGLSEEQLMFLEEAFRITRHIKRGEDLILDPNDFFPISPSAGVEAK